MKARFDNIDGWRGIAIVWVVVGHGLVNVPWNYHDAVTRGLTRFFLLNYLAVDIFFIISGLFVAQSLRNINYDYLGFIKRKVIRLLPMYFIVLL